MADQTYCTCCGKLLKNESTIVMLEFNSLTGEYLPRGSELLPIDVSQGFFPFGASCAKKMFSQIKEK